MHLCPADAILAGWNANSTPVMAVMMNGPWWLRTCPSWLKTPPVRASPAGGLQWLTLDRPCGGRVAADAA